MTLFESLPEEVWEVVKAMACYRPRWSVHGAWVCDFCNASKKYLSELEHKPECAVLKAKALWPDEFGGKEQL